MNEKTFLVLERSAQNLQKIVKNGKTMLEGVFAEFGRENRNGRIYEEQEYLPHLEYLRQDIKNGSLLGELDHPERFEVALGNVSHRITELWYDQSARQVKGRIEVLEGTPKGQIAKALLEAGVPLSISSRAAGTVRENKTVSIQQIYTYDLVAKPGFEAAQLHEVSENMKAPLSDMIKSLNESVNTRHRHSLNQKYGILNEDVTIIDIEKSYDKPISFREEALKILKENNTKNMGNNVIDESYIEKWTKLFSDKLEQMEEKINLLSNVNESGKNKSVEKYVEKLRKIQEDALNWQSEIAVALNKVANTVNTISEKANEHKALTDKIHETVDYNAKVTNHMQEWTSKIAKVTNVMAETIDHNAEMLNKVNEWSGEIAIAVNKLNEWGVEKAKAINALHEWGSQKAKILNAMHEWQSSQAKAINGMNEWVEEIAEGVNTSATWTHEMLGRTLSKDDAVKLMKYVDLVAESKKDPALKQKLDELLSTNSITKKPLSEAALSPLVLDKVKSVGDEDVDTDTTIDRNVEFDKNTNTIIAKLRDIKFKHNNYRPLKGKTDLEMKTNSEKGLKGGELENDLPGFKTGLKKTKTVGSSEKLSNTSINLKSQNLKLNAKPTGKLSESLNESVSNTPNISERRDKIFEKLSNIQQSLEKERRLIEDAKKQYPFIGLLSEADTKRFLGLSETDKKKVSNEVYKVPTNDSNVILQLWESALKPKNDEEPLWLKLAPKAYREQYEKSPNHIKESINAKSEYLQLNTPYQIQNFWETTGLISKASTISLNEVYAAKTPEESTQKFDSMVAQIGDYMQRYKN